MSWDDLPNSYDVVARTYETTFLAELDGKPRDRQLLTSLASTSTGPVVDVGCGPGHIGAFVKADGRWVAGLDRSPGMAELAGRRLDAAGVADMRDLPLASARIGALVAFYSLIHLPRMDVVAVLREFHRVLRPGGRVLLSVHEGEGRIELDEFLDEPVPFIATLFTLDEVVTGCTDAGLLVTLAERRPPYPSEHPTWRVYVMAQRPPAG